MGVIRKIIVVGGALLLLPSPPRTENNGIQLTSADSWGYISAAAETVSDFKSFCERKPQVCVTAQYLASGLEQKAKYNAKLIYEWANESVSDGPKRVNAPADLAEADPLRTSSTPAKLATAEKNISTLRLDDLLPEWQGKKPREKG